MWDAKKPHGAARAVQLTLFSLLVRRSVVRPGICSSGLTSFGKPDGWIVPTDPGGLSGDDGGRTVGGAGLGPDPGPDVDRDALGG